ncbi:hypothetical protein FB451DRAFT_1465065 [Mycena latifolia]|nr:hypothetical protein FB451DRAFT_1465065 [Mycena latifolia]
MSTYSYRTCEQRPSSALHNGNAFSNFRQTEEPIGIAAFYNPSSPFQPPYFTPLDPADYTPDFIDFNDTQRFLPDLRADGVQAHIGESLTSCASVGAQNYHTQSINDGLSNGSPWFLADDLALHTLDIAAGEDLLFAHPEALPLPPRDLRRAHQPASGRYHGVGEGAFPPSYHALDTPRAYARGDPAAPPSRAQSPPPRRPDIAHNFVHMNEASIMTDLPEESPFALVSADSRASSFAGHPYPDGHRWPQTFKITEVKQIGPKKQTLACFFCRSRKIACAPRPVDGRGDRSCEYVLDFT